MLAAIIGGLAAVIGLGMAVVAILATRAMNRAAHSQPSGALESTDAEATDIPAPAPATEPAQDDPNAFVDPFANDDPSGSDDNPNAFVDPFAPDPVAEDKNALEWGSPFDDAKEPDEKWGFDATDTTEENNMEISSNPKQGG